MGVDGGLEKNLGVWKMSAFCRKTVKFRGKRRLYVSTIELLTCCGGTKTGLKLSGPRMDDCDPFVFVSTLLCTFSVHQHQSLQCLKGLSDR